MGISSDLRRNGGCHSISAHLFLLGLIDAASLPGPSVCASSAEEPKRWKWRKNTGLERNREFCYFGALFCLGSGSGVRNHGSMQCVRL